MLANEQKTEKRYYFDWAASAPFMTELCNFCNADLYGNPSSDHNEGKAAKKCLEDARSRIAAVLNVPAKTLFFTCGGTESNSIALFSNLMRQGKGRITASAAEHSSIREGIETLSKMGKPTGTIPVDSLGRVTSDLFMKALTKYGDVHFASCMAVNNETGAITDIAQIRQCAQSQVLHCDLVQAAGKIPFDIEKSGIDLASFSAHKIGGPRGIGLLYLRSPGSIDVFYPGGGQESGVRGGTENVLGALALASCLEKYATKEFVLREHEKAKSRQNMLIETLKETDRFKIIPEERTASDERFSPYILQAAFNDIPGEVMTRALDDLGFAVSTGSACSSVLGDRPVLVAMGINEKLRMEGIRISQGFSTTEEEIALLTSAIKEVLKFL